jgi:hypothetical protein
MTRISRIIAALLIALPAVGFAQNQAYTFKPDTPYKYLMENKNDIIQEMMGNTNSTTAETTLGTTITLKEQKADGVMDLLCTVDNAILILESDQGMKTMGNSLAGKSFWFTMKGNGEVTDGDTTLGNYAQDGAQMVSELMDMLPLLEREKLVAGSKWDYEKADTMDRGGGKIIRRKESEYSVTGTKTVKGHTCLEITFEGETSAKGKGEQGGQEFNISGSSKEKGTILFDVEQGVLVEMTTEESGDQTISLTGGQSMKINITQTGTSKLELVTE